MPSHLNVIMRAMGSLLIVLISFSAIAGATEKKFDDNAINAAVETDLWVNPAVDANFVDSAVEDGIVTLTGTVEYLLAKDRAQEIAASTVGVRAVVNRIRIQPKILRKDDDLKAAVQAALDDDPATAARTIEVGVSNGVVTLRGKIRSWAEKQLCEATVKGVWGVRDIKNELVISHPDDRTDATIEREVVGLLTNNVRIDDYLISAKARDGVITLTGIVGSLAELNLAEVVALSVFGVRGVENKLTINWKARDEMRRKALYLARSDEEIQNAVKDAFSIDPRLISWNPIVEVDDGTVTLKGVVEDLAAKTAAEQDARNVIGVQRVRNLLKVRPKVIPSDDELKARIARALSNDPIVARFDVSIDANNGLVTLTGRLNGSYEKKRAELVAMRVKGVTGVLNSLQYDHAWVPRPDREIRKNVRDQFYWSPFIDSDEIKVEVQQGIVTLSGSVETWGVRDAAEENAWEGGAKDVQNRLTVANDRFR